VLGLTMFLSGGIDLDMAVVTRSTQVHQDLLVRHFSRFAAPFRQTSNEVATQDSLGWRLCAALGNGIR
jgi:hypothetical protein